MKRYFRYALLLLTGWTAAAGAEAPPELPLWSGEPVECGGSGGGAWRLLGEHGRLLTAGTGAVRIELPALPPGSTLAARLETADGSRAVRFYAPRLLYDVGPLCIADDVLRRRVAARGGMPARNGAERQRAVVWCRTPSEVPATAKLAVIVPKRKDFPLRLPERCRRIVLYEEAGLPGMLSLAADRTAAEIGLQGKNGGIEWGEDGRRRMILSPDFCFDHLESMLFLHRWLQKYRQEEEDQCR